MATVEKQVNFGEFGKVKPKEMRVLIYHIVKSTMDTHRYYNRKIRASTPARNESSCATGEDRLSHPSHKKNKERQVRKVAPPFEKGFQRLR